MKKTPLFSRLTGVLALVALAACDGDGPTADLTPEPDRPVVFAAIQCRASTESASLDCVRATPSTGGNALIVGGQGTYVQLTSSNVSYNSGTGAFAFDVNVQNLIPQAMATTDGTTQTPEGVRIVFHSGPTATSGTGNVSVANADGTGTFTQTNQPYFQYSGASLGADGILATNEASSDKGWVLQVDPTVGTFAFTLYVVADVQFPDGWVDVTPAADSLLAGTTQALTATVRSAVGLALADPVVWTTSDGTVGTVDGAGVATAVAPGTVTITATAGTRTGSATLAVCPNLGVGDVYTATMPGAAGLCLGGGSGAVAEYTYMPVNLSSSSALSLSVTGSGIVGVTGPPTPNRLPGGQALLGAAPIPSAADDALHLRMMERDRAEAARLAGIPGARIQRSTRRPGGPRAVITPGVPSVGDLWQLNVASGCSGATDMRTGRVVSVGQHVVIVADTTNPAGGFTTAQYDSIALEFDSLAYPVDTANFGGPTDLDGNQRVVAFYTRAVNELSPPASSAVVAGYFTARDLFSSAPGSCERSNEGEMFYMLVPDPTGAVNSNVRTVSFVRGGTVGTMAHELQHLISASRRTYIVDGPFEEVWLNEGLSHVAEELVFYRTSVGLTPRSNIVVTMLTTGANASRRVAAFNTYANQNYGRLRSFLQRPDTAGVFKSTDVLAVRGATWSFLRYASDRVNGTEATFWWSLVNSTATGTANLQSQLGVDPNEWVRDWITAMYADDAVSGVAAKHTNPSWNYRSIYTALNGSYQLVPRPLSNGVALTLSYSRGGGTAYMRFGVPADGFAGITALSGGAPPATPYALSVIRTK